MPFQPEKQPEKLKHLSDLVKEHQVVYETWRLRMGFDVELYGTHGVRSGHQRVRPGCERCEEVWQRLYEIAAAVLPSDDRESRYQIRWFRPALSYDTKRQRRADVELVLEIRHRRDYNAEVDACEKRCADEIVARLKSLGAREGTWSARRYNLGCRDGRSSDHA